MERENFFLQAVQLYSYTGMVASLLHLLSPATEIDIHSIIDQRPPSASPHGKYDAGKG